MDVDTLLAAEHGVVNWPALRRAGMTLHRLRRALHCGELRRLRRSWYATPTADPTVAAAVAAGGVCTCVSALRLHGVWIPEGHRTVHKRIRPSGHNTLTPAQRAGFCRRYGRPLTEYGSLDDVPTALAHALRCLDPEDTVVVLDSIQHLELMHHDEIEVLLRTAPPAVSGLLDLCAPAEAGTETMARLRLRGLGLTVRSQVRIPGLGRVDLLIGERLILEVDGQEYHHTTEQFHRDRERDLTAYRLGYLPMRMAYRQVVHGWDAAVESVLTVVERGEHLIPPSVPPIGAPTVE